MLWYQIFQIEITILLSSLIEKCEWLSPYALNIFYKFRYLICCFLGNFYSFKRKCFQYKAKYKMRRCLCLKFCHFCTQVNWRFRRKSFHLSQYSSRNSKASMSSTVLSVYFSKFLCIQGSLCLDLCANKHFQTFSRLLCSQIYLCPEICEFIVA